MENRNKFLKEAVVLLVVAIFIGTNCAASVETITETSMLEDETLIDEDFEDPWVPDANGDLAPEIWEMEQTSTEVNQGVPCWWHQYYEEGENYAGLWFGTLPQDEWLMTRTFDLSVYTEASLEFQTWNFGFHPGYWEGDFVEVSDDGGDTWDVLANLYDLAPPDGQFFGELIEFDLTDYCGNSAVIVAFHRLTENPNMNFGWWMIDNVLITAGGMIPIPVVDIESISGGFGVTTVIKNYGTGEESDVEWSIHLEGGFILIGGDNSGDIAEILPDDEVPVKTGFIFGIGRTTIEVDVNEISETATALVLGPFVVAVAAKSWIPVDNYTINWRQCTVTVNSAGTTGSHSVQFVDKDGNIIASKSGWDFGTTGSATGEVETWIKNKLRAGGDVNVRV